MKNFIQIICLSLLLFSFSHAGDEWQVHYVSTINSELTSPTSLAVSSDRIAVLEPFEKLIKQFSSSGVMLKKINIDGDGSGLTHLNNNEYLFCDYSKKQVILVDLLDNKQSNYFKNIFTFVNPVDIILSGNKILILDAGLKQIIQYNIQTSVISILSIKNTEQTEIDYPSAFSFDRNSQTFYILNQTKGEVWVLGSDGTYHGTIASFGGGVGQISRAGDIVLDNNSLLYISDRYQSRVLVYTTDGDFVGNIDFQLSNEVDFYIPIGLAVDENNLLYVASTESKAVQIFYSLFTPKLVSFQAQQIYPMEFDTVETTNITLTASALSIEITDLIDGFDFEIYESSDTLNYLMNADRVQPIRLYDSLMNSWNYQANWTISKPLESDRNYYWRSRVNTTQQVGNWSQLSLFSTIGLPVQFKLHQNYPNPFNPSTVIKFDLSHSSYTTLSVYNVTGQLVTTIVDKNLDAGHHEVIFSSDNLNLASGIYFYKLSTETNSLTKKMVIIK